MQYAVHVPTGISHEDAVDHWQTRARENSMVPVGQPTVGRQGPVLRIEGDVERALAYP